jgi:hypothetical protein
MKDKDFIFLQEAYDEVTSKNPVFQNFNVIIKKIENTKELEELAKDWKNLLFFVNPNQSIKSQSEGLEEFLRNYFFYTVKPRLHDDTSIAMHRLLGTSDDIHVALKPKEPQTPKQPKGETMIQRVSQMFNPNEYIYYKKVNEEENNDIKKISEEEFFNYLKQNEVDDNIISSFKEGKTL